MRRKQISIHWIFILFTVFTFTSCEIYQEVKVKRVEDFDLSELTNNHVAAVLRIGLENPNPYKITLYESDLELRIDGNAAGTLSLAEPVVLGPKSSQVYSVKVFTNITDVEGFLGNALSLMFKDEIELQASGYVQAKGLGVKKMVPLSFTKPISRKAFKLN
ncbi:MAG: LEA type 2 family protein [Sediminibacterium sp.]